MPLVEVEFWRYVFGLENELADIMEQNTSWTADIPK